MCDKPKPGEDPPDIDVETLIALTRQVALATVAATMRDVMAAIEIDDKQERLQAVASILMRIELERHRSAN